MTRQKDKTGTRYFDKDNRKRFVIISKAQNLNSNIKKIFA